MNILDLILIIIALFIIYIIFFRNYVLAKAKFKCKRCGNCCKLRVRLNDEDIKRIKKAGYKDFFDKRKSLKRINGYCMFLTFNNGVASCKINNIKPKICGWWPIHKTIFGKEADPRCCTFLGRLK